MKKLICIVTDADYEESILNCYADDGKLACCHDCVYWRKFNAFVCEKGQRPGNPATFFCADFDPGV